MSNGYLSSNHSPAGYLESRRKRRWKEPDTPREYRGTVQEFIRGAEEQAKALGASRPVEYWGMNAYARNMYGYIVDQQMLYRAWTSLKGMAHGVDGVSPGDIGRFAVFKEWCVACQLFSQKAPAYTGTVFPHLTDFGLYVFHCMNDPERRFATTHIEFGQGGGEDGDGGGHDPRKYPEFRKTIEELRAMKPGFFAVLPEDQRNWKIQDVARRMPGKTRKATTPMRLMLPGVYDLDDGERERYRDLLRRTGLGEAPVEDLANVLADGIGQLLELEHNGRAKSFITGITPLKYITAYLQAKDEDEQRKALKAMRKAVDWAAMRWIGGLLAKPMANGKGYKPQPFRTVEIRKDDRSTRSLSLPTATDRIGSKSAHMVLQPVMEGVFLPSSVGCRSDRDRFDALAALADRYPASPGKFILVADIQKAFDNVPHDRLMEVIETYVPNPETRVLLERFIRRPGFEGGIGLAQGDPLSPLFLNMLLHDYLDVPIDGYMQEHGLTYFRYVDDLAVFGLASRKRGEELIDRIGKHLSAVGLSLHTKKSKTQIVDLARASAEYHVDPEESDAMEIDRYLGLGLRGGKNGELEFFLPSTWEKRIREMYVRAERMIMLGGYAGQQGAYTHIFHATESWIEAFAPALQYEDKNKITQRIVEICNDVSRHPVGDPEDLHETWDDALDKWAHKCAEVANEGEERTQAKIVGFAAPKDPLR